jgi:hypothetical protein
MEDIGIGVVGRETFVGTGRIDIFEDMLGVEEFGVNVVRCKEITADYEYLCGDVPVRLLTPTQCQLPY